MIKNLKINGLADFLSSEKMGLLLNFIGTFFILISTTFVYTNGSVFGIGQDYPFVVGIHPKFATVGLILLLQGFALQFFKDKSRRFRLNILIGTSVGALGGSVVMFN